MRLQQFGRAGGCQRLQVSVVLLDLGIQQQPALGDCAQARLGRRQRGSERAGSQGCQPPQSVILPLTWSSFSRRASGEQTMIALSVCMACVLALTAVSRAILR